MLRACRSSSAPYREPNASKCRVHRRERHRHRRPAFEAVASFSWCSKRCTWRSAAEGRHAEAGEKYKKEGYHGGQSSRVTGSSWGCATSIGQSCPTGLPIVVEFTTVAAATDSDDRIGTTNGPEHSGAFEPGGDESFTGRFDHS